MSWTEYLRSANWNQASWICLCTYLLGCFTAGYYLVRLIADKDIREIGSGSVGARNVGRVLGRTGFLLTVLCDCGKGALAVWAARQFTTDDRLVALAMLAVVIGHIWPAQLRFHGGKGMATSLGALVVYDFYLALAFGVLFVCLALAMRKTVLPSQIALACVPGASFLLGHTPEKVIEVTILAALVLIAHRKNLIEEFSQLVLRRNVQPKPDRSRL